MPTGLDPESTGAQEDEKNEIGGDPTAEPPTSENFLTEEEAKYIYSPQTVEGMRGMDFTPEMLRSIPDIMGRTRALISSAIGGKDTRKLLALARQAKTEEVSYQKDCELRERAVARIGSPTGIGKEKVVDLLRLFRPIYGTDFKKLEKIARQVKEGITSFAEGQEAEVIAVFWEVISGELSAAEISETKLQEVFNRFKSVVSRSTHEYSNFRKFLYSIIKQGNLKSIKDLEDLIARVETETNNFLEFVIEIMPESSPYHSLTELPEGEEGLRKMREIKQETTEMISSWETLTGRKFSEFPRSYLATLRNTNQFKAYLGEEIKKIESKIRSETERVGTIAGEEGKRYVLQFIGTPPLFFEVAEEILKTLLDINKRWGYGILEILKKMPGLYDGNIEDFKETVKSFDTVFREAIETFRYSDEKILFIELLLKFNQVWEGNFEKFKEVLNRLKDSMALASFYAAPTTLGKILKDFVFEGSVEEKTKKIEEVLGLVNNAGRAHRHNQTFRCFCALRKFYSGDIEKLSTIANWIMGKSLSHIEILKRFTIQDNGLQNYELDEEVIWEELKERVERIHDFIHSNFGFNEYMSSTDYEVEEEIIRTLMFFESKHGWETDKMLECIRENFTIEKKKEDEDNNLFWGYRIDSDLDSKTQQLLEFRFARNIIGGEIEGFAEKRKAILEGIESSELKRFCVLLNCFTDEIGNDIEKFQAIKTRIKKTLAEFSTESRYTGSAPDEMIGILLKFKDLYKNDLEKFEEIAGRVAKSLSPTSERGVSLDWGYWTGGRINFETVFILEESTDNDLGKFEEFVAFFSESIDEIVIKCFEEKNADTREEIIIRELVKLEQSYENSDIEFLLIAERIRGIVKGIVMELKMVSRFFPELELTNENDLKRFIETKKGITEISRKTGLCTGGDMTDHKLDEFKEIYGTDLEKFEKIAEIIVQISSKAPMISGREVVKFKEVYGTDLDKLRKVGGILQTLAEKGQWEACNVLFTLMPVYGTNIERMEAVAGIISKIYSKEGGEIACTHLPKFKEVYGTDLGKLREIANLILEAPEGENPITYFLENFRQLEEGPTKEAFLTGNPPVMNLFLDYGSPQAWRGLWGDERYYAFRDALPKKGDEARNAFTRNQYDRTTSFIRHLVKAGVETDLMGAESLDIMQSFIQDFGLSKTSLLYVYYKNIKLKEMGRLEELPSEQLEAGITSIEILKKRVKQIRSILYSSDSQIKFDRQLSPFELAILDLATGKSTHTHGGNRVDIGGMVENFRRSQENGAIAEMPEGYATKTYLLSDVDISFDAERIRETHARLQKELMEANEPDIFGELKKETLEAVQNKIAEIKDLISKKGANPFFAKQLDEFENLLEKVNGSDDLDSLLTLILKIKRGDIQKMGLEDVLRKIVFARMFERHRFSEDILGEISRDEIAYSSVATLDNILSNVVKDHVLGERKKYWSEDAVKEISEAQKKSSHTNLVKIFSKDIGVIKETIAEMKIEERGQKKKIRAIPDRGFAGEMSGYLANACYTKEYPLLSRHPNLVPYKFVVGEGEEKEFAGSVLIFEVDLPNGEKAMLVRAFNIPNESMFDVPKFFEKFVDELAKSGKKRGVSKILIPGTSGAISNYGITLNYLRSNYITEKSPVSLADKFAFNGYDITQNCFVVRSL
jgi:hypothetical protein